MWGPGCAKPPIARPAAWVLPLARIRARRDRGEVLSPERSDLDKRRRMSPGKP